MAKLVFEHIELGELLLIPQSPSPNTPSTFLITVPYGLSNNNNNINTPTTLAIMFI